MLSKKAKYALSAMVHLTRMYGKGPILISEIAREEDIPKKFLELILLELKKDGLLESRKGRGGGYMLGRPPDTISVGQVVRLTDGPLAPLPCVSQTAYRRCDECRDESTCAIRHVMKEVRDSTARILDGTTLLDMMRRVTEQAKPSKELEKTSRKKPSR